METYKLLFSIVKMPTVFTFCVLLLTAKVRIRLMLVKYRCLHECQVKTNLICILFVCFRSVSLLQMQLQVWSWWRKEFLKRSWRCWQYPWCLCRSSYLSSSANTQQGLDLWMSSTKHSHLGRRSDTQIQWLCVWSKVKVTGLCSVLQVAHWARVRSAGVVDPQCETRRRIPSLLLRHSAAQLRITSGLLFCCCLSGSFSVRFTATQGSNCTSKLFILAV